MDLEVLHFFSDEVEKTASGPWNQNAGAFASVAGELDDGGGFTVSDLRKYLRYPQSRSSVQRPTKPTVMWTSSDAEDWLIFSPNKHRAFVRWARGK